MVLFSKFPSLFSCLLATMRRVWRRAEGGTCTCPVSDLGEGHSLLPTRTIVACRFCVGLFFSQVGDVPFYSSVVEDFYQDRMLNFVRCFFSTSADVILCFSSLV